MPSQISTATMAVPTPRRGLSPLIISSTFGQDVSLYLDSIKANTKAKTPYVFNENEYAPTPAPPPPSPIDFGGESWSTACRR